MPRKAVKVKPARRKKAVPPKSPILTMVNETLAQLDAAIARERATHKPWRYHASAYLYRCGTFNILPTLQLAREPEGSISGGWALTLRAEWGPGCAYAQVGKWL